MSDIRNRIYTVLKEYKNRGKLYHATDLDSLLLILETDSLTAPRPIGISVSRSPKIDKLFGVGIVLVLDGDKISEKYKIFPFSYEGENAEEEVIQTNKNLPLVWKTPEHNNAFLSIVNHNDNYWMEGDFMKNYNKGEGSTLPSLHKYLIEIRIADWLYTKRTFDLIEKACQKSWYKNNMPNICPLNQKTKLTGRFLMDTRKGLPLEQSHKLLNSLGKNEKDYLKKNFDKLGYKWQDDIAS